MTEPRITFVYTPMPYLVDPSSQVGLGLLLLATYAKDLGAKVSVLVEQASTLDEAKAEVLLNRKPEDAPLDCVCLTGCMVDAPVLNAYALFLKQSGITDYVAVGGPIGNSPEVLGDHVDLVVSGPGEDIIEAIVMGERPKGRLTQTTASLKHSPNYYPSPDRTLLPLGKCGGNIFHEKTGIKAEASTTILTSRGCYSRCAFCTSGTNEKVLFYNMDRVRDEVDQALSLRITSFRVSDDNLLYDLDRLVELCSIFKERGCTWRASIRVKPHAIDMFRLMRASGCTEISFGVESADPAVLSLLRKGQTIEQASCAMENAQAAGMPNVRALMMMATPGETSETLKLNKALVHRHPDVTFCMTAFMPFPGTAIYHRPATFGCRIVNLGNPNIYLFRADESTPESHIEIIDGLSREMLTEQLLDMRAFLEEEGQANFG